MQNYENIFTYTIFGQTIADGRNKSGSLFGLIDFFKSGEGAVKYSNE